MDASDIKISLKNEKSWVEVKKHYFAKWKNFAIIGAYEFFLLLLLPAE